MVTAFVDTNILAGIDGGLRRFLLQGAGGEFLWSKELRAVYPRDPYWWLWVAPPTEAQLDSRQDKTP